MPFEWQTVFPALMLYHGLADEDGIQREHLMRWVIERLGGNPEELMQPKAYLATTKATRRRMKAVATFKRGRGRPPKTPPAEMPEGELTPAEQEIVNEVEQELDDALV